MSRRPKFSRRDNYWFWHSFVVCIFDNKFLRRPIVISDDLPTYWALIDAFYDFWWFWPTAVYTARELYELTSGRFRILFYIVCGQKKSISWWKKTHAICHNGLFWSNPFFVNFATSTRDADPGGFLHIALLQICPRTYVQQIGKMRCGICAGRHGPHAVAGHTCTTYAKIVDRGHGNHIFWPLLLRKQPKLCWSTYQKQIYVITVLKNIIHMKDFGTVHLDERW